MFTYSIRISVPEACMLGGLYYSSCQLYSRHWIFRSCDRVVSDVAGEGVIGEVAGVGKQNYFFVIVDCAVTFERSFV